MNEHPDAAIIRSGYEAMEKGDMAALAALLDDGITWHESTPGFEGDYHAHPKEPHFHRPVCRRLPPPGRKGHRALAPGRRPEGRRRIPHLLKRPLPVAWRAERPKPDAPLSLAPRPGLRNEEAAASGHPQLPAHPAAH